MSHEIENKETHIHIHLGGGGGWGGLVFVVIFVLLAAPIIANQTGINLKELAQNQWTQMQQYMPRFDNMSLSQALVPTPPVVEPQCQISRWSLKRGLIGKSRVIEDGNYDGMLKEMLQDTQSTICHNNCIMRIQAASQVMVFNDNTYMRLVGNWMSTGLTCAEEDVADNLVGQTEAQPPTAPHPQKAAFMLIPLYKGYKYAYDELSRRLFPSTTEQGQGSATANSAANVWSYLPESVQSLGWKAFGIIFILILIMTNFTGGLGKVVAIILILVVGWLVFF